MPLHKLLLLTVLPSLLLALPAGWPGGALPARGEPPRPDEQRLRAAGIRRIEGRHLTLYTDVAESAELTELPTVFDAAVPQWCRYFEMDPNEMDQWRIQAYLIERKEPFRALGLLPDDLPPFLHGYQRGDELWLYEQPTAYYRRHLLLHEGTHAFMQHTLGGAGPPWYMEGVAELLATHRWSDGQLTLKVFPASKQETPGWGRIKIVRDALSEGRGLTLPRVMQYDASAHRRNEPYGWCWAATAFLDAHPKTREAFRARRRHVADTSLDFSRQLHEQLEESWPLLEHEWQLFALQLNYGYDVQRNAVVTRPLAVPPANGLTLRIAADRGWQSTGLRVEAGRSYGLSAEGRFQIARDTDIWWCEPNGVTLRYFADRPLGELQAAVCDESEAPGGLSPLVRPQAVGLRRTLQPPRSGTLFLKLNDDPAQRHDNQGFVTVRVVPD